MGQAPSSLQYFKIQTLAIVPAARSDPERGGLSSVSVPECVAKQIVGSTLRRREAAFRNNTHTCQWEEENQTQETINGEMGVSAHAHICTQAHTHTCTPHLKTNQLTRREVVCRLLVRVSAPQLLFYSGGCQDTAFSVIICFCVKAQSPKTKKKQQTNRMSH